MKITDKDRLDFLEKHKPYIGFPGNLCNINLYDKFGNICEKEYKSKSLRDAINNAIMAMEKYK